MGVYWPSSKHNGQTCCQFDEPVVVTFGCTPTHTKLDCINFIAPGYINSAIECCECMMKCDCNLKKANFKDVFVASAAA